MNQVEMDFLKARGNRAIKTELQSIIDSYHHYWDPLAELLQNSRDAITRSRSQSPDRKHFIRIAVDAHSRRIEVLDNGVGIPESVVTEILGPGGGDKDKQVDEVGEKGVGLTYAVFCSDEFALESRHNGEHHGGCVKKARSWRENDDNSPDPPHYKRLSTEDFTEISETVALPGGEYDLATFTKISIASLPMPEDDYDLFALSGDQLRTLITTRTAVGITNRLFIKESDWTPPFDVYLDFKLPSASTGGPSQLDVGYKPPHRLVKDEEVIRLADANAQLARQKEESKKRKLLHGKTIWEAREVQVEGRTVSVYGVMFPGNKVFDQLSDVAGLTASNDKQDPTLLESAILVGTKGMPTGISIPEGPGGAYPAYYKRCLFVVESDSVRFDMGRKSMHHVYRKRLQSAVTAVFKEFENLATYQSPERVSPKATPTRTKAERDAQREADWKHYEGLVDLGKPEICFQKVPDGQEAAVAAIFHELLGAGELTGYLPLSTGYSAQYDLHAHYQSGSAAPMRLAIEFKHSLESLVKDFEKEQKNFDDIHLLVVWKADAQKLKDSGFILETAAEQVYEGVTHELSIPVRGIDPIPVILLEDLIKR